MSSSKQMISIKFKEQYLELIVKQKTAASNRCQQQISELIVGGPDGETLFSSTSKPVCQPAKFETRDSISMTDDDFLLAELNGQFQ